MSRKSHRRKKQSTGLLNWFRSQQNLTKIVYWIVGLIFVGGAFVGFGGARGGQSTGGCSQMGGQKLTAEQRKLLAEPIAKVGDVEITRGDFEPMWRKVGGKPNPAEEQGIYIPPPEEYYIHRSQILDGLIMQSIIEQEAAKKGITVQQKEIDKEVDKIKEDILGGDEAAKGKRSIFQRIGDALTSAKSDKTFEARLQNRMGMTPAQLEKEIQQWLLQQKFSSDFSEEVKTELDNEAKEKADSIKTKLDDGEDFEALVEEYSDDRATIETGGLVEDIKRISDQPREIIDMAFEMAVGEISPPFKISEKMDFGQGEPFIFESYVIIELLDKRTATDEDIETELEELRELIRGEKWEKEKETNPDVLLEDIDVNDEEISEEYDKVSYRSIKIDSNNVSLQNQRAQDKITAMREAYETTMLDPQLATWTMMRDGDFETAREEWALHMAEADSYLEDPGFLALSEEEKEDEMYSIEEREATLNYIYGLLFRMQISGYQSQYGLNIPGEKEEKRKERWEIYNEDPEAWGEDEPDLQEPTDEEKEHYRALNEEALPYFNLALDVIQEEVYMFLHRGETNLDLENYDAALADFEIAAEYASDDLRLNSRLENDTSQLLGMFDDEETAQRVRDLMDQISEKVDRLQAELQALQEAMQGAGGMPSFGGQP